MKSVYTLITFLLLFLLQNIFAQSDLETIQSEEELIQFINAIAPDEDAFVAVLRLAKPFIDKNNWAGASALLYRYREYFPEDTKRFDKIIKLINARDDSLETLNIVNVNTDADEYFPVISIDGTKMYFTGNDRADGIKGEDIFLSVSKDGIWQRPVNLGPPFSTNEDDAINSISADGITLVLFGNYKGAFGGGDNFFVQKNLTGWSEIKLFPKPVNSINWDCDGFLTADGKAFLFTSDRKGNIGEFHKGGEFFHGLYEGNTDIYVSLKTDSGWSKPINLGKKINTPYTERSPFLHPDGKTMYFSSDGYYGLGGLDVYKIQKRNDSSWTEWSEPVNLGKEINTSGNDIAYKITTDGTLAYFASDKTGNYDIYSVTLPESMRPMRVITIKGVVTDENDKPLDAELKWFDLRVNRNVGIFHSDFETGEYMLVLPIGNIYGWFAEKFGYYSVSNEIDLSGETIESVQTVNIKMISVKKFLTETPIVLNNIYFDFDKYELKPESFTELERVAKFLNDNPVISIEISAHTDSQGSDEYNLQLSQKRAQSVVNHLISNGIKPERLKAMGYGETMQVATNETEEGRAQNRRVEMKVLK